MNQTINTVKKENFSQVCIWPATIVGEEKIKDFEDFMIEQFKTRIQYLEEIKTSPDLNSNGDPIEGSGNRNDVFFAVHDEDIGKFAVPRLQVGVRWIEDVLAECNYSQKIYPSRIVEYKTWMKNE